MANLKTETIEFLKENNKNISDILWCGSEDFGWFNTEDFFEVAPEYYDSGYGGQEIAKDLVLVGKDFWIERHEYDGSEWWEFKSMPKKPENYRKPVSVHNGDSWATLEEMNRIGGKYI